MTPRELAQAWVDAFTTQFAFQFPRTNLSPYCLRGRVHPAHPDQPAASASAAEGAFA
jgi:hypothetical protein